jgi:urea transport system substrate-binding protein
MTRIFPLFAVTVLTVGGWALYAAPARAQAAQDYKIGYPLALSGTGSVYAEEVQQGIALAVEEINAKNLAGRKFVLITVDDANDPKTAADVCSRLVLQDKVDAIVGSESSPARVACNQFAQKAGIPYVGATYSAGDLCIPNVFSVGAVASQTSNPMLDYLLSIDLKKVYIIGSDYSASRAAAGAAEKVLKERGGETVGVSFAPFGNSDFASDIAKITAAKPKVLLEMIIGADAVTFHKQFSNDPRSSGIKEADFFLSESTARALGKAAAGTIVSSAYLSTIQTPENKAFLEGLKAKFGAKAKPDVWGVLPYNALYALAGAVKTAGTDPKAVMATLSKMSFTGPNGENSFENNYVNQPIYIGQVSDSGAINLIKNTGRVSPQLLCKF